MTNLPKSASPSEPRPEQLSGLEEEIKFCRDALEHIEDVHDFYAVMIERLRGNQAKPWAEFKAELRAQRAAEPRRGERELAVTIVDGLLGYTVEFSNDKASHAADYNLVEGILRAARASAAPLEETPQQLHPIAEGIVDEVFNALDRDCEWNIGKEDTIRKVIKRLQAASLPSPLECPKCGWTADEGDGQPVKINPQAVPQPSAGQWKRVDEELPNDCRNVGMVINGAFHDPVTGYFAPKENIWRWQAATQTIVAKVSDRSISHWCELDLPVAPSAGQPPLRWNLGTCEKDTKRPHLINDNHICHEWKKVPSAGHIILHSLHEVAQSHQFNDDWICARCNMSDSYTQSFRIMCPSAVSRRRESNG